MTQALEIIPLITSIPLTHLLILSSFALAAFTVHAISSVAKGRKK